jgi:tetratricopeptide (TPR) repeat protein
MKNYYLLMIFLVFFMSCATTQNKNIQGTAGTSQNTTYLDESVLKGPGGTLTAWITYGIARHMYRDDEYFKINSRSTAYQYTFAEEVFARKLMACVWPTIKKDNPGIVDNYLDKLADIMNAGFLPEYVWSYLWVAEWGTPPVSLKLKEFSEWKEVHLKGHHVETHAFPNKANGSTGVNSQDISNKTICAFLENGVKELQNGNPSNAISIYLDPVIKQYEAKYSNETRKIYCARTPQESLLYQIKAVSENKKVLVIDYAWAQAYYLKGYAEIDLGNLEEAKGYLNKAIALSPSNASYHSELAQVYQLQKKWPEAIASFENALEPALTTSPETIKNIELLRAKRGIAYSLIELGKLEEAEQHLTECLTIDPNDEKSQDEIQYIKSLKSDNK